MCLRFITPLQPRHHPLDAVVENVVRNTASVASFPRLRIEIDVVPRRLPEQLDLAAPPKLLGLPVCEHRHRYVQSRPRAGHARIHNEAKDASSCMCIEMMCHARTLTRRTKTKQGDRAQRRIRNINLNLKMPATRIALAVYTAVTHPPLAQWKTKQWVATYDMRTGITTLTCFAVCASSWPDMSCSVRPCHRTRLSCTRPACRATSGL